MSVPDTESGDPSLLSTFGKHVLGSLAMALLILAARFEIVDSPVFDDVGIGIFREAKFLGEHGFRYGEMMRQPTLDGENSGPRAVGTSMVPGLLAVAFSIFASHWAPITVYHLLIFFAGGWCAIKLYTSLRTQTGALGAVTWMLAGITLPAFCVPLDLTGIDLVLAGLATGIFWALTREWHGHAFLSALTALAIHPRGMLIAGPLLFVWAVRWLASLRRPDAIGTTSVRRLAGILLVLLILDGALTRQFGVMESATGSGLPIATLLLWAPDVVALLLVGTFVTFADGTGVVSILIAAPGWNRKSAILADATVQRTAVLYAWSVVLCVLIFAHSHSAVLPRTATLIAPLAVLLAAPALFATNLTPTWSAGIAGAVIVLNLLNWNGDLYPNAARAFPPFRALPVPIVSRTPELLTRSHEYLEQHRTNQELTRMLAHRYFGTPIVAPEPIVDYLTIPELGYVREVVTVYSTSPVGDRTGRVLGPSDLLRDRPRSVVFVSYPNLVELRRRQFEIPQPEWDDTLTMQDPGLPPIFAYEKHFPPTVSDDEVAAWYQRQTWCAQKVAVELFSLVQSDRDADVAQFFEREIAREPVPGRLLYLRSAFVPSHAGDDVESLLPIEPTEVSASQDRYLREMRRRWHDLHDSAEGRRQRALIALAFGSLEEAVRALTDDGNESPASFSERP